MADNKYFNQNKKAPDGINSIADDEAITEIDLGDFLEENSKSSPLFEGFHEDIENTEKSLASDIQNLYDNIMSSGPETIVPKPMSVLTEKEKPKSALEELWMNPEDYFDADIPVFSLDDEEEEEENEEIPEEAFFNPEAEAEAPAPDEDFERNSIFSMIDSLKSETDSETGFSSILSEIESNEGIATTIDGNLADAQRLVSADYTPDEEENYEEVSFGEEEFDWDESELVTEPEAETTPEAEEEFTAEEDGFEVAGEVPDYDDFSVDDIVKQYATAKPETPVAPVVPVAESSFDADNISTDSEEFDRELAYLLGEEEAPAEETPAQSGFVVNISDDETNSGIPSGKLYESAPMSSQPVDEVLELVAEDGKKKKKKDKKNKKAKEAPAEENGEKKASGAGEVIRKIVLSISVIVILVSCGILANTYLIEPLRFKKGSEDLVAQMQADFVEKGDSTEIEEEVKQQAPQVEFPEGMLAKYAQLYAANDDLRGWISIPGLGINLPIAQGTNNDYYLKKDIYGKYTTYGVPFFDYRMTDFVNLHKNNVIYGHNMRYDDLIFGMLENYRFIEAGFQKAPVIECNTIYGDFTWFVYAVFISNSKPEDDNGYVFPYNYIDVGEGKFQKYIDELDKRTLYHTGVDLLPTDKILTLSTCSYDFEDARLVVVARLRRDGESVAVDTSKAYPNDNIKYPQKWYDVNNKTNNFASDPRW